MSSSGAVITAASLPNSVKTTNGARPVGKGELIINAQDYGAVGDGVTDDTAAITEALAATAATGGRVIVGGKRTYSISQLTFTGQGQSLEIQDGAVLHRPASSDKTDPMVLVQRDFVRILGGGKIQCDNDCPDGIVRFQRTDSNGAVEWCRMNDVWVKGPGASIGSSNGIVLAGQSSAGATFQNVVSGVTVSDVETGIAHLSGANMNHITNCTLWHIGQTAHLLNTTIETTITGGSVAASPNVTTLYLTGSAFYNRIVGLITEPGGSSAVFRNIDAGCHDNQIIGCSANTANLGTDNGANTFEVLSDRANFDVPNIGFFGAAPTAQPTVPAAGTITADDLRAALVALGLVQ